MNKVDQNTCPLKAEILVGADGRSIRSANKTNRKMSGDQSFGERDQGSGVRGCWGGLCASSQMGARRGLPGRDICMALERSRQGVVGVDGLPEDQQHRQEAGVEGMRAPLGRAASRATRRRWGITQGLLDHCENLSFCCE